MVLSLLGQRQRRRHGGRQSRVDLQAMEKQKGGMSEIDGETRDNGNEVGLANAREDNDNDSDNDTKAGCTTSHESTETGGTYPSAAVSPLRFSRFSQVLFRRMRGASRYWKPSKWSYSRRLTLSTVPIGGDLDEDDDHTFASCSSGGSENDISFVPYEEGGDSERRQHRRRSSLVAIRRRASHLLQQGHRVQECSARCRDPLLASLLFLVGTWVARRWGFATVCHSTTAFVLLRLWVVWSAVQVCFFLIWWLNVLRPGKGVLNQAGACFGRQVNYLSQPGNRQMKMASVVAGTRYTFDI